ncbi:hypothetical protein LEN26_000591 [Aphanomyces euteiches]|nr:hypothetical protein AeMF1_001456 [Aphanomyces euteiches]KAH9163219.1 hypothetical protein LEN26_000591 [Aphanomyces euteiches]KAH9193435.1 hypothetical protein AeNC1_004586 [Aphanomyces euteiches]
MESVAATVERWVNQVRQWSGDDVRSPVEKLLDEHLTDNASGIATTVLHDFASRTFNPVDIKRILGRLWHTLQRNYIGKPHIIRKALVILHHCLVHGSKHVALTCGHHPLNIAFLREVVVKYDHQQPGYVAHDIDAITTCRKLAQVICDLLDDPTTLEMERVKAMSTQRALSSRGLGLLSPQHSSEPALPPYFDNPNDFSDVALGQWELGGVGHTKFDPDDDLDDDVEFDALPVHPKPIHPKDHASASKLSQGNPAFSVSHVKYGSCELSDDSLEIPKRSKSVPY